MKWPALVFEAYEVSGSLLVKYYDNGSGGAEDLTCPCCQWSGCSELALSKTIRNTVELSCPECSTALGLMSVENENTNKAPVPRLRSDKLSLSAYFAPEEIGKPKFGSTHF